MPTTLRITPPADYVLARDVCSYGYFLLEPNHWDPARHVFTTTLEIAGKRARGGRAVTLRISQGDAAAGRPARGHSYTSLRKKSGASLLVRADAALSAVERRSVRSAVERMLHLRESAETVRAYHRTDARFRRTGRARLMRSPTLFEDVLKTVTSCNVQWPSTIVMNRRLCEVLGKRSASGLRAFPSARAVARALPAMLRERCRVGYRDARIVELARMFDSGEIEAAWVENSSTNDEELWDAMLEWPGIGPYAAANIMQLLGRYHRLPLDSESVRHGRDLLGFKGSAAKIMKRVHRHYQPMGEHKFRSYWFELWEFYERKRGPAWTWERETTGKTFTASQLAE